MFRGLGRFNSAYDAAGAEVQTKFPIVQILETVFGEELVGLVQEVCFHERRLEKK